MGMPAAAPQRPSSAALAQEDELVRQHLPLVGYAVSDLCRRLPSHVQRDDLTSAGMAALAAAARSFDESHGVPFGRYAARRIQGALLDELRSHDWASRSLRRRARDQEVVAEQMSRELGRPATDAEVAARMGVEPAAIAATQHDVHRSVVLSFQAVTEAGELEAVLPSAGPSPDQVLLDRERDAYLRDAVALLPERLRTVVVGIFFDERPLCEIAAELSVTESRVSQMRSEAVALLKDGVNAQLAPELLAEQARPDGRVARRKESYYAAIAARSDFVSRISLPAPRVAPTQTSVA
jgi:RNA polymerase sigma factor for flagellar operon FliA